MVIYTARGEYHSCHMCHIYIKKKDWIFLCELLHVKFVYKHSSEQNSSFSSPASCASILVFFLTIKLSVINQIKIKTSDTFCKLQKLVIHTPLTSLTSLVHASYWIPPRSAVVLHSLVRTSLWLLLLVLLGHLRSLSFHFVYTRETSVNLTHFDELMLLSVQLQRLPVKSPSILVHIYFVFYVVLALELFCFVFFSY